MASPNVVDKPGQPFEIIPFTHSSLFRGFGV